MTWPFASLTVGAFRGLRDLRLDGLGRINLLVGGTNSGKTSVLEALSVLQDPLDPLVWIRAANQREPSPFAAMMTSNVDRVSFLFPLGASNARREVTLAATGPTPVKSVAAYITAIQGTRPDSTFIEAEDGDLKEVVTEVERRGLELDVSIETAQAALFSERRAFQIWERESVHRRGTGTARTVMRAMTPYDHWLRLRLNETFSNAVLAGEDHAALELLRRCDPSLVGAALLQTQREPMLYLRDARAGLLPISSFGDGVRRVLALALELPRAAGGVLLIDEIETGLHVSMLTKVFSWVVETCHRLDIQLFVTTHSLEALDAILAADPTADEDTICYQLERTTDGPRVKRFGENQAKRLRSERGLDLR